MSDPINIRALLPGTRITLADGTGSVDIATISSSRIDSAVSGLRS